MTVSSPPFLPIQGVFNFRTLSSLPCSPDPLAHYPPTPHGYRIRPGILFRCAQLNAITPDGALALTDLGIRRLYDLRSERERPAKIAGAGAAIPGFKQIWTPVFRVQDASPEGLARKYRNYTDPDEDKECGYSHGFVRAYRDILVDGAGAFTIMFEHLRDRDLDDRGTPEPLLFHCSAGKDRTGVFAALALRLCGVALKVVEWEYALTNVGLGSWREEIVTHMMGAGLGTGGQERHAGAAAKEERDDHKPLKRMTREQAERAIGARARNMSVFVRDVLEGEFGGVEQYMKTHCGFGDEDIERIKKRLIVEGDGEDQFGDGTGYWRPSPVNDEKAKGDEGDVGLAKGGSEREKKIMMG